MKRAVLCGYYGMGNGGDEALLATLLQMLPANVQPIVLSQTPAATAQRYGVAAVDRWNLLAVWQALRQADAFVWGGGSLVQDVSSKVSPLYYLGLMKLAQLLGLKTIAWAQGIGPLTGKLNRAWTQDVLSHCAAVSVRDRGSSELLTHWGIAHTIAPDPVWAMEVEQTARAANSPPVVAVNLRQHSSLTEARLAVITQALQEFQQQTQAQIWLVPFQASLDLELAQLLHQRLPEVSEVVILADPEELRRLFDRVDGAIVMRLHAFIMAAAAGCHCFALSYDPKVTQVATSLNLPVLAMGNVPETPEYLVKAWVALLQGKTLGVADRQTLTQQARQHQLLLTQLG